eukprot:INCI3943.1.p1 GENE.INCI3943.1~~INCI3943.1.p1  ORF type:complete len:206 (-),score=33.96 INCI3943.1:308-925(-)
MGQLRRIYSDSNIKLGFHVIFALVSLFVLVDACVLANDVYGGGPALVAIAQALALLAYACYDFYVSSKRLNHGRIDFGLSVVVIVSSAQSAVMWGGLTSSSFQSRFRKLAPEILNATNGTCLSTCPSLMNETAIAVLTGVANSQQEKGAEIAMCALQLTLMLLWIPYTLSQVSCALRSVDADTIIDDDVSDGLDRQLVSDEESTS